LCDVYSIGAIAYELLTGRLVPPGQAQPPSAFNPGVEPTVDELVLAAIDCEPDQRPYTARALMSGVAHAFREMDLEPDPAELGRLVAVVSPEPEMRRATGSVRLPGRPQPKAAPP